jgi:hypothetical protein
VNFRLEQRKKLSHCLQGNRSVLAYVHDLENLLLTTGIALDEDKCHGCDLNAPIFALFLHIFILCFRAATVVAKYGLSSARLQHVHGLYLV